MFTIVCQSKTNCFVQKSKGSAFSFLSIKWPTIFVPCHTINKSGDIYGKCLHGKKVINLKRQRVKRFFLDNGHVIFRTSDTHMPRPGIHKFSKTF